MTNHVMIDLETLGNTTNAAFIALGAVVFDPNKPDGGVYDMPKTYYERVDWESACKGRSISPSTVKWWMQQSNDARTEVLKDGQPLLYASSFLRTLFSAGTRNSESFIVLPSFFSTERRALKIRAWKSSSTRIPISLYFGLLMTLSIRAHRLSFSSSLP